MKNLLLAAFALSLCSCSFIQSVINPNPNIVATLESGLAAADNLAMPYVALPKCGSKAAAGSAICSDAAIVKNIGAAAQAAYTAVKAAEANETASTVTAAQNAVSAYQTIVSSLQ